MTIHSPVLGAVWLASGGYLAHWFYGRRSQAVRDLRGYEGSKPSEAEADGIRMRAMLDAFIASGAWVALFVVLAWLESLFSLWGQ
jgi:hypothetical protein